ncbi:hypothetical protein PpBr36_07924 [Pyricularia pennisetigena]|uniref:hypothetical protein n=1 Tax=Pyricularia pennisetigena TaxID=1578925 RepID=UPI00114FDEDB|nr:hypothetical protein PpBr36_07924 [Pyricularia pennisetigena]TLS25754.1 hypothetical protein PpBr36_07924 [Pyricularia pennisetigena]
MASEISDKSTLTKASLAGLKPRDMEILSLMVICSSPESLTANLANVNFESLAVLGGYKNAHAAKTAVGIILKKLHASSSTPENGSALPPLTPKKRKASGKKTADDDDDRDADTPAKKPRARAKKAASAEPASMDVDMDDQGGVQTE